MAPNHAQGGIYNMGNLADLAMQRFGMVVDVAEEAPGSETLATILSHRTHRRFLDKPVAEDTMNLLFACALSAPAKSDLQQVAIIRVQNPEKRKEIAALMPEMGWIGSCPVFLLFCGDSRRIRKLGKLRGNPQQGESRITVYSFFCRRLYNCFFCRRGLTVQPTTKMLVLIPKTKHNYEATLILA